MHGNQYFAYKRVGEFASRGSKGACLQQSRWQEPGINRSFLIVPRFCLHNSAALQCLGVSVPRQQLQTWHFSTESGEGEGASVQTGVQEGAQSVNKYGIWSVRECVKETELRGRDQETGLEERDRQIAECGTDPPRHRPDPARRSDTEAEGLTSIQRNITRDTCLKAK